MRAGATGPEVGTALLLAWERLWELCPIVLLGNDLI